MENKLFKFCALCFKPIEKALSDNFCKEHLPATFKYRRDRNELISRSKASYHSTNGRLEKTKELSGALDKLSVNSTDILRNARKVLINGKLDFNEAIDLVKSNYKQVSKHVKRDDFSNYYYRRRINSYFVLLGYELHQVEECLIDASEEELFDAIIYISARVDAYKILEGSFSDDRGRPFIDFEKWAGMDKVQLLNIVKSMPRKPNGRINRQILGGILGVSRYKAGRIINKLKSNGDISGDI